ncbi:MULTISPECIES: DUF1641 domain-containing protein [Pseudomonas]|uniref:DUF1641 domain-containing protein n=1 Tax=Pseudomonas protegens (strain DSM 19095 / LMG 27888 / CFBP 6595 / CHA0) TaxID=1124983 RepID=A0A2C9EHM1_PSEPH|nr:DUF1641 domain-containing protein [Pseudomonas protegens]AGL83153.1 hypothetical protein PFLCHA0_c13630 [Pseudomonas protegens CHA0]MBP5096262.1 DUF1641 domain-containing protein [Pseudomonas protegens]MBP5108785.1 DUF1641 domain-containing protein [Pseudomonas protegens]MBP5114343.1 DUF1641 domain-containing protein [Pseudomonas protegens]NTZ70409.1 DUF1641 domain-containing protein [Pseudomonas protegens]
MDSFDPSMPGPRTTQPEVASTPGLEALMKKLQPLLDSARLDNMVDLLSLLCDLIDMLDQAMIEKLAQQFEEATAASWILGNALRMAKAETSAQGTAPSLYGLLSLLREEDTRRGAALLLRTLNVIGRQL